MDPKRRRPIGDPKPVKDGTTQSSKQEDEVLLDLTEDCLIGSGPKPTLGHDMLKLEVSWAWQPTCSANPKRPSSF